MVPVNRPSASSLMVTPWRSSTAPALMVPSQLPASNLLSDADGSASAEQASASIIDNARGVAEKPGDFQYRPGMVTLRLRLCDPSYRIRHTLHYPHEHRNRAGVHCL